MGVELDFPPGSPIQVTVEDLLKLAEESEHELTDLSDWPDMIPAQSSVPSAPEGTGTPIVAPEVAINIDQQPNRAPEGMLDVMHSMHQQMAAMGERISQIIAVNAQNATELSTLRAALGAHTASTNATIAQLMSAPSTGGSIHRIIAPPERPDSDSRRLTATPTPPNPGHRRPTPQIVSRETINSLKSSENPKELLTLTIKNVMAHERCVGQHRLDLTQMPLYFTGEPMLWVTELLKTPMLFANVTDATERDEQTFIEEFIKISGIEVRPEQTVALEKLLSPTEGIVLKIGESVTQYAQRFKHVARVACGENWNALFTQRTLCQKYCDGLYPDLRAKCVVDDLGNDWHDLEALIKFSLTEERRLNAISRISPLQGRAQAIVPEPMDITLTDPADRERDVSQGVAAAAVPGQQQQHGRRRPKMPADRAERIKLHSPLTQAENPRADGGRCTWETARFPPEGRSSADTPEGFRKALEKLPYSLRPVKECPYWGYSGRVSQAREDPQLSRVMDVCAAWWICQKCHEDRHAWTACPNFVSKEQPPAGKRGRTDNESGSSKDRYHRRR